MLYSQNLLKAGWVVVNHEDAVVIDSNKTAEKKLSMVIGSDTSAEEVAAYRPVSFDETEENLVPGLFDEAGAELTGQGDEAAVLLENDENVSVAVAESRRQADEIIETARRQAEEIVSQAAAQAEAESRKAYDQAYEKGMQDGYRQGMQNSQAEVEARQSELLQKEQELNQRYQQQLEEMEPCMVRELTGIYEHIFRVDLSEYRSILQHLIANTLRSVSVSDTYLIHVSEQDYSFVTMQKPQIIEEGCVGNAGFEIVEDRTLSRNECLIETEDGIFDCSLAVELKELKRKLQLLSYTGKKE